LAKEESLRVTGLVHEVLGNSMFRIKLENEHLLTAYIGGKLRMNTIKVVLGDSVEVELSPYDVSKGRIVFRNK